MKQNPLCTERILSFAVMKLPDAEQCARLSAALQSAKYYTQIFGNTVLIFNILYEDAKELARERKLLSFLYARNSEKRISLTILKWGLIAKNKGRLRRGYFLSHSTGTAQCVDGGLSRDAAALLSEYGLTEDLLYDASAVMLKKLEQR